MRYLLIPFLGVLTATIQGQNTDLLDCLSRETLERTQDDVIDFFNSKIAKSDDTIAQKTLLLHKLNYKKRDINTYQDAASYFDLKALENESIASCSIIELYYQHDLFEYIYIILQTKDDKFYAVSYNVSHKKGQYIGQLKDDYFFKMIDFMSQNIQSNEESNYIIYFWFSIDKTYRINIEPGVDLSHINQILLIESILLNK